MVELAGAQSERRKHSRLAAQDLVVEIRGKRYDVLDISFGGIKVAGCFTVAGGLVDVTISPVAGTEKAEVRGRVERVDGDLTVVRFSHLTDALTRLITRGLAE
jgi:hypothetical protein